MSTKISNLPAVIAASIQDTDVMPLVASAVTSKVTIANLRTKLGTQPPAGGRTVTDSFTYLTNNAVFNVKDFGAFGDGATDDTVAIQLATDKAALASITNVGAEVYFPPGRYVISTKISVPQNKHVSFTGRGRPSGLIWAGGNNTSMIHYVGGAASPDAKVYVRDLFFYVTSATGISAIKSGGGVSFGIINLTVRGNMFQNVDIALETNSETDSVVFEDNWLLVYTTAGVKAIGGGSNSNYFIKHNHFQGGAAGSYAVDHTGGSNVVVDSNSIESGSANMKGIRLTDVADFRVTSNYFEVSTAFTAGHGPFLALAGATTNGVVEANHTTGDTGNSVITVAATVTNVRFGPNRHGISGGTPTAFIAVTAGATDIFIYGKQDVSGGSFPAYSGDVSAYIATDTLYVSKPINVLPAPLFLNINNATTSTIFVMPSIATYIVTAKNVSDDYYTTAIVTRTGTGNAKIFVIHASSANLALSVSGNNVQATNNAGVTRTIEFSAIRIQ